VDRFRELVGIREETGRPVAYLVGRRSFRDLDLFVDERVLVPRPETEHAVDVLLDLQSTGRLPTGPVVDRGTGSGAIALSLLAHLSGPVIGIDNSAEALQIAALNAAALQTSATGTVALVRSDCLTCFAGSSVAAIIANPPYIAEEDFASLPDDVRVYEPRVALVPEGGSPSAHYSRLVAESARVLLPGGWLVTEVGMGQAEPLASQLRSSGWDEVRITEDLAGIGRVVSARRA
jgi:release factor glutamine methyltransferase